MYFPTHPELQQIHLKPFKRNEKLFCVPAYKM